MNDQALIVLNNVTTGYSKDKPLLKNYSLELYGNTICCLMGESGCGKTTLLRTIAGLTPQLSGDIHINTENKAKDIYMMHQNYASFNWLTTLDNILIAKKIKGKVTKEDKQRAIEILKSVGLEGNEQKYPTQLSGGQRQRLALARTIFMKPKIIFMDEPMSGLDENTRQEVSDLILDIQKETKCLIVMITHNEDTAKYMCSEVIRL